MARTSTEIIIGKDTKYAVSLRVDATGGKGFSIFVSGGDRPHVGGACLISPKGEEQRMDWGNHKDSEIALEVARVINDAFREPVACAAGVEIKDATEADEAQLKMNYCAAVRHFIGTYERRDTPL